MTTLKTTPFEHSYGFRFRGQGFSDVVLAGEEKNIDFRMDSDKYVNGVQIMLNGHVTGDHAHFQIIDVDNILGYGAGFVLDEFANTWYFSGSEDSQGQFILDYPAKILQGLYIRLKYQSTGQNDVKVFCNTFLHKYYG